MNWDFIYALLSTADDAIKIGQNIHDHLTAQTGLSVAEIRAQRDGLSQATHSIIDEELARLESPKH